MRKSQRRVVIAWMILTGVLGALCADSVSRGYDSDAMASVVAWVATTLIAAAWLWLLKHPPTDSN